MSNKKDERLELARQLWFWQASDTEGSEHAETFAGQTIYSENDWDELLIPSEQKQWLERAERLITLFEQREKGTHR